MKTRNVGTHVGMVDQKTKVKMRISLPKHWKRQTPHREAKVDTTIRRLQATPVGYRGPEMRPGGR
jgi:hypothetical protein